MSQQQAANRAKIKKSFQTICGNGSFLQHCFCFFLANHSCPICSETHHDLKNITDCFPSESGFTFFLHGFCRVAPLPPGSVWKVIIDRYKVGASTSNKCSFNESALLLWHVNEYRPEKVYPRVMSLCGIQK